MSTAGREYTKDEGASLLYKGYPLQEIDFRVLTSRSEKNPNREFLWSKDGGWHTWMDAIIPYKPKTQNADTRQAFQGPQKTTGCQGCECKNQMEKWEELMATNQKINAYLEKLMDSNGTVLK